MGIATNSFTSKLQVHGTLGLSASDDLESGNPGGRTKLSSSASGFIINHNDNSDTIFQNQGSERLRITSGGVVSDSAGGLRTLPQNAKSSSYTLIASDVGKHVSISSGNITVPQSVFSIGDIVTIYNNSASSRSIIQGTGATLRKAGTVNTGTCSLSEYGTTSILCVASNVFVVSGNIV